LKPISCKHGRRKDFFQGGAKSSEISFFPVETKKTTFFAKNVLSYPPDAHVCKWLNQKTRKANQPKVYQVCSEG